MTRPASSTVNVGRCASSPYVPGATPVGVILLEGIQPASFVAGIEFSGIVVVIGLFAFAFKSTTLCSAARRRSPRGRKLAEAGFAVTANRGGAPCPSWSIVTAWITNVPLTMAA